MHLGGGCIVNLDLFKILTIELLLTLVLAAATRGHVASANVQYVPWCGAFWTMTLVISAANRGQVDCEYPEWALFTTASCTMSDPLYILEYSNIARYISKDTDIQI